MAEPAALRPQPFARSPSPLPEPADERERERVPVSVSVAVPVCDANASASPVPEPGGPHLITLATDFRGSTPRRYFFFLAATAAGLGAARAGAFARTIVASRTGFESSNGVNKISIRRFRARPTGFTLLATG